ncbi:hypothetical protein [Mycolicibacter sinensis]|uniref:hypothetical protein n=1 Tax=Mycolicibacter sinensis (strain JDM601) TaxID=875328 RepID=UPI0007EA16E1|nr:hypothetical protein [Mycolicibacter sinensis]OBH20789.1 hypothetical protein A5694_15540 [Mycolicibacter sinensis]
MTAIKTTDGADRRTARRAANQSKFDWCRDIAADPAVSPAAGLLGCITAIDKMGSNGRFKATQKELGRLIGATPRTIRRAVTELASLNYWTVEQRPGANEYAILGRAARVELWQAAEKKWLDTVREWRDAEYRYECEVAEQQRRQAIADWLAAEQITRDEFTIPIYTAAYARAGHAEAARLADRCWGHHQAGSLPTVAGAIASVTNFLDHQDAAAAEAAEGWTEAPPAAADMSSQEDTIGTPGGQDRTPGWTEPVTQVDTAGALTSTNGDSHKYVKSVKTDNPASAAPDGARGAAPGQEQNRELPRTADALHQVWQSNDCPMCDPHDGVWIDPDGCPVAVFDWDVEGDLGGGVELVCQHSVAGNLAEAKRVAAECGPGGWAIGKTRWLEIDAVLGCADLDSEDPDVSVFDARKRSRC